MLLWGFVCLCFWFFFVFILFCVGCGKKVNRKSVIPRFSLVNGVPPFLVPVECPPLTLKAGQCLTGLDIVKSMFCCMFMFYSMFCSVFCCTACMLY